jgi:hypothetical protein
MLVGCSKSPPKTKSTISIDQVPAAAMKTAQAKEPSIKFDNVIKRADGEFLKIE